MADSRANGTGNDERLRARFASLPHESLVEVLTRVAASVTVENIDSVLSEVAPLPAWCVTDVLLSPDLITHILGATHGRESHRAAHVCSAWAAWRRRDTQNAADEFLNTRAINSTVLYEAQQKWRQHIGIGQDSPVRRKPSKELVENLKRAGKSLEKLAMTTICRPSFPTFSLRHLMEAEARRLQSTWMPACGFTLQPAVLLPADVKVYHQASREFKPVAIWKCTVPGIDGTLMDGALFTFDILFAADYPLTPPYVRLSNSGPGFAERFHNMMWPSGRISACIMDQE